MAAGTGALSAPGSAGSTIRGARFSNYCGGLLGLELKVQEIL
jgi:hypothetical protein